MAKHIFGTSPLGQVSWEWVPPEDYDEPSYIKITVEATSLEVAIALFEFFPDWQTSLVNEEFRQRLAEHEQSLAQIDEALGHLIESSDEQQQSERQADPPIFSRTFRGSEDFVTPMKEAAQILGIIKLLDSEGGFKVWGKILTNLQRLNSRNEEVMNFLALI